MLQQSHLSLRDVLAPESADWRLRLSARGGDEGDLGLLLAICRSADSHAYQVLEHGGVRCAQLRRDIIERMRAEGEARLRSAPVVVHEASSLRPRLRRTSASPSPRASAARPPSRRQSALEPEMVANEPESEDADLDEVEIESAPPTLARPRATESPSRRLAPVDPGSLSPMFGRAPELARLADALGRQRIRAPLLVGPSGSGRTTVALALAQALPHPVFRLIASAYESNEALEHDLRRIAEQQGIAILDDLDRIASDTPPPFLGALGHAWTAKAPRLLVVTSPEGHGRLTLWLPGLMESVDAITLDPLEGPALEAAVKSAAPSVLEAHGVELARDAKLSELTRWAERYLGGLAMPGRALDLLDLACARVSRCGGREVDRGTWLEIVSERSGLPPSRIEVRGDQDVLDLEQRLAERVVGHRMAISTLAQLVRRNRAGFGGRRPIVSALLLGPSGIGKTELAKALGQALFERDDALVRLDMSEYAEAHAVARIVGAPPGYVGHEQGGTLSDPLLRRPHCVVLLDEIEKAHRDVHQLLLQVFDEGRLTDGRGRVVDFRHAAIVMTSNLGAEVSDDEAAVLAEARAAFPIELWNRIEAPLVMRPLGPADLLKISRRLVRASSERLFHERGIRYALTDAATHHLLELSGLDPKLGARPLRHLLQREVESCIADAVLRGEIRAGSQVEIDAEGQQFVLRQAASTVQRSTQGSPSGVRTPRAKI